MTLGDAEEDFRGSEGRLLGDKDGDEEELLDQAIAVSKENEEEIDEEELLKQAIALSLEDWN